MEACAGSIRSVSCREAGLGLGLCPWESLKRVSPSTLIFASSRGDSGLSRLERAVGLPLPSCCLLGRVSKGPSRGLEKISLKKRFAGFLLFIPRNLSWGFASVSQGDWVSRL